MLATVPDQPPSITCTNDTKLLNVDLYAGDKVWLKDGKYHRDNDLPAIVRANGNKWWYTNGKIHRVDNPAFTKPDGEYGWYFDGLKHKSGGPAIFRTDGSREWWINGKRHMADGPAIIRKDGQVEYWLDGVHLKEGIDLTSIQQMQETASKADEKLKLATNEIQALNKRLEILEKFESSVKTAVGEQ